MHGQEVFKRSNDNINVIVRQVSDHANCPVPACLHAWLLRSHMLALSSVCKLTKVVNLSHLQVLQVEEQRLPSQIEYKLSTVELEGQIRERCTSLPDQIAS